MENNRPSHHIELPLVNGEPINGTIRTPATKVLKAYNKINRDATKLALDTNEVTEDLKKLHAKALEAEGDERDEIHAQIEVKFAQMEKLHDKQCELPIEQLKAIVILPNKKVDGEDVRRGLEEIDWDSVDRGELAEAIDFFEKRSKSSTQ